MALINCPECGREVSNRASACIHCGCPFNGADDPNELVVVEQRPLIETPPESTWIIGSEWTLPEDGKEQRVHCLDCDRDVYFPAGQDKHSTHKVEPLERTAWGDFRPEAVAHESEASDAGSSAHPGNLGPPHGEDWEPQVRWRWARMLNFRSRTRRSEFWTATLVGLAVCWSIVLVGGSLIPDAFGLFYFAAIGLWIWIFWGASVNRLHDIGQSGSLVLLYFVPIANLGLLIYVGVASSEAGPNEWGPPVA